MNPAATVNWRGGPTPSIPITGQCFAGDFNGDGKTDLACYLGNGGSGSDAGVWSIALSTGSSWQLESWGNGQGPALPVTGQCVTGDFNGDGKTDIACFTGFAGEIWSVSLSTGSGWNTESWSGGPLLAEEWNVVPIPGQCFAADFNGDGKTDLACSDGVDDVWSVALSTGSGWNTGSWSGGPIVPLPITQQCLDGDLNGDGKADLFCWTGESGGWGVALSTGSGFHGSIWSGGPVPVEEWNVIPVPNQCFAADFTGNKMTDIGCSNGTNGMWNIGLSNGSGWNTVVWSGGPIVPLPMTQQCLDGDLNGDGKADLFCWTGESGGWGVALSSGNGFQGSVWGGGPVPVDEWNVIPVGDQCFTGDFNGDGLTDVACYSGSGGNWNVALSSGSGW
ncbi:MAG: VCBS repeat-containing protein [Candidatus Sulfotelmatobacter sp.]